MIFSKRLTCYSPALASSNRLDSVHAVRSLGPLLLTRWVSAALSSLLTG